MTDAARKRGALEDMLWRIERNFKVCNNRGVYIALMLETSDARAECAQQEGTDHKDEATIVI